MTSNSPATTFACELQEAENGTWGYCIKRIETGEIVAQSHGHERELAQSIMEYDLIVLEDEEAFQGRSLHEFRYEVSQADDGLWQYQIHEKATNKVVGANSDLRDRDTAYSHIAHELIRAGCSARDTSRLVLQGQEVIDVDEQGIIHLKVEGLDDDA